MKQILKHKRIAHKISISLKSLMVLTFSIIIRQFLLYFCDIICSVKLYQNASILKKGDINPTK